MKNLALISLMAGSVALSGCQMFSQQQTVEEAEPLPVVTTGTCVFGSKSGKQTITTTHTDCALRGGNFIADAMTAPAPTGSRVETL